MKYLAYALVLMFNFATLAGAAELKFQASWPAVTEGVKGSPLTPDSYLLYVCDEPITASKSDTLASDDLVGRCEGRLQTYRISGDTKIEASYDLPGDGDKAYFRVSACKLYNKRADGTQEAIESDLSPETVFEVNQVDVAIPKPPGKPDVKGPTVIHVMP